MRPVDMTKSSRPGTGWVPVGVTTVRADRRKYLFSRAQQQRIHYLPTIFMKKKIGKKIGKKQ